MEVGNVECPNARSHVNCFNGSWTVENFTNAYTAHGSLRSKYFQLKHHDFKFFLRASNRCLGSNRFVYFDVCPIIERKQCFVAFELCVGASVIKDIFRRSQNWCIAPELPGKRRKISKEDLIKEEALLEKIKPRDTIIVDVHLSYSFSMCFSGFPFLTTARSSAEQLAEDMNSLRKSGKHCDVQICVEDRQIPAHKSVLSARSPVFAAMFEHDTLENSSGRVEICDTSYGCIESMLDFIYSGSCGLDDVRAVDLFGVADKYSLDDLKRYCSLYLIYEMNHWNAYEIMLQADLHNDTILKKKAMAYIVKNFGAIGPEKYVGLIDLRPTLYGELTDLLAKMINKSSKRRVSQA